YVFFSLVHSLRTPPTTLISPLSLHDALPILRLGHHTFPRSARSRSRRLPAGRRHPLRRDHRSAPRLGALRRRHPRSVRSLRTPRSEEHTSELQSRFDLVCRLLLEKKNKTQIN